jgi:hypothetical protein
VKLKYLTFACVLVLAAGCGSKTPGGPGPIEKPPPDPGPVIVNTPPVIGRFTVQGSRTNEPPNFADVLEDLPISVQVTDAESNVNDLKYTWSAPAGTFSGSGTSVIWKAPADAVLGDVTINLEIVETYTSQGKSVQNTVKGSTVVSLHDSLKEVGDMARQFLLDFSDSNFPTSYVMRNFQPDCYGTADETADVSRNRADYNIVQSAVGGPVTSVQFGGTCPFRSKRGDGCARVSAYWKSLAKRDIYTDSGVLALRAGQQTEASGIDHVAAMYYRDQKRWRLCDSQFEGSSTSLTAGTSRQLLRGMVP